MTKTTPRYVLPPHGEKTFEFPIVRESSRIVEATLSVSANTFGMALAHALDWSQQYTTKFNAREGRPASDPMMFYPEVKYQGETRLAKKVAGSVWTESRSHGAWVPVEVLTV